MSEKHTPTPWIVWEPEFESPHGGDAVTIIIAREMRDDVNQEIAYVHCRSCYFQDSPKVPIHSDLVNEAYAPAEAAANARRIVACVNFVGDTPTETLEATTLAQAAGGAVISKLRQERDALLESLTTLLLAIDADPKKKHRGLDDAVLAPARNAIALTKGGGS